MMEYKVAFNLSFDAPWVNRGIILKNGKQSKARKASGKLTYCGHTLEEAVEKFLRSPYQNAYRNATCTSLGILRGREKGRKIKWSDYQRGNY